VLPPGVAREDFIPHAVLGQSVVGRVLAHYCLALEVLGKKTNFLEPACSIAAFHLVQQAV